ncbi:MAG: hypothetical protein D6715_04905 [Calditrichaeota bacterium]|nr:MAG: hypothetical protein D6715_04905 [Calditrichota bacterium]
MPRLSQIAIRLALIHLLLAFGAGSLLLCAKALQLTGGAWRWLPVHQEVALLGWVLQLIYGVAYWILPRFSTPPFRGNALPMVLAVALLNAGVLLAALSPLLQWPPVYLLLARGMEAGSAIAFAWHAWPRIKPYGS